MRFVGRWSPQIVVLACAGVLLAGPARAAAQEPERAVQGAAPVDTPILEEDYEPRIGPFVVDVRGSLARFGENPLVAANLGVRSIDLATSGFGMDLGAHVYFLRWRAITFGVGGNYQYSWGENQVPADAEEGTPEGPRVRTQLKTFVPQLSFNFGTGRGWSYLSGGMSPVRLDLIVDGVERQTRTTKTINWGGGARWFTSDHMAVSFDVRFYAMNPLPADGASIGLPRMTLTVINVGVSFK